MNLSVRRSMASIALLSPLPTVGCAEDPFDTAMPPVALADLKPVLDADLARAIATGPLAPSTHHGVTIGIFQHGVRRIYTYGAAQADSVFEIGSITKTFTGLMLAQMVRQGIVRLDQPIRELLPPGTVAKPASGDEITLLDISTQHAALPRLPDNLNPRENPTNPYVNYDTKSLYAYIAKHGVAHPTNSPFLYSNLAVGLLGTALANRAGVSYSTLLHDQITGPLGMTDTGITLTPAQQARFIQGYAGRLPAHPWDMNALAGAGAIRSTVADMLTYLEAQLHPDDLPASAQLTPEGKTLPAAITASQVVHAEASAKRHIALNWLRSDENGAYWHNGGTGGYSSYATFNPEKNYAIVVLYNSVFTDAFADTLGIHIAQRLTGRPAVKLVTRRNLGEWLRSLQR